MRCIPAPFSIQSLRFLLSVLTVLYPLLFYLFACFLFISAFSLCMLITCSRRSLFLSAFCLCLLSVPSCCLSLPDICSFFLHVSACSLAQAAVSLFFALSWLLFASCCCSLVFYVQYFLFLPALCSFLIQIPPAICSFSSLFILSFFCLSLHAKSAVPVLFPSLPAFCSACSLTLPFCVPALALFPICFLLMSALRPFPFSVSASSAFYALLAVLSLFLPAPRPCLRSSCTAKKFRLTYFPAKELRGLSPNFHIHVSVSDLYIPSIGPHIFLQKNRKHECRNWD